TIPPDDFFRAAFSGFSISLQFAGRRGVGIGDAARLYAETDPTFDGENWRIGWFEFVPLEVGTVQFFLQVGEPGIGRSGATAATPVYFGSSTEAAVLGNQEFAESAEADALLTIRVMPDYNRNGAVDAADYVVWRKTVGSATELRADGNGDGAVDVQDYNLWKSFFGMVNAGMVNDAAASTEATAAVPEPNALSLIAAAMVGFLLERFRRKGQ
ncbi:MAG TPA: dockerin type I domain-containing protein, partial [Lacipirellulaceae bacterium]|nr:dockerin type I domain-containing protein [Lacipirellulaceae bacterium]